VAVAAGVAGAGILVFAEAGWVKAIGVGCLVACAVLVFLLTSILPTDEERPA
jgi:hypothetical protein